uniref:Retrotransposon gag domain-containing protein n=1 Tax=Oryza brachyantha TaxID=4533 RepID=J3LW84_ORYBR
MAQHKMCNSSRWCFLVAKKQSRSATAAAAVLNLISFTIASSGKIPSTPTSSSYELYSRGPAVLGADALVWCSSIRSNSLSQPVDTISPSLLQSSLPHSSRRCRQQSTGSRRPSPCSSSEHNDRPPRFQKMDIPKYDDKSDPLAFINRNESYFHQQRIVEEEKVWMASYNLEDGAQMWFIQVQQDEGTPQWHRFTKLLHLRFGPPLRCNPLGELMACKRTGSIVNYQDKFEALLSHVGTMTKEQCIQIFTIGLQPPLSLDVEIHDPQLLAFAMNLAPKTTLLPMPPQWPILPAPQPLTAPTHRQ